MAPPLVNLSLIPWVALGGALGATARFVLGSLLLRLTGPAFPWGTLSVNVLGSFAMGLAAVLFVQSMGEGAGPRAFAMVGVLGGFTTFSAFSLDVFILVERGNVTAAGLYVGLSVATSILALVAGVILARNLFPVGGLS